MTHKKLKLFWLLLSVLCFMPSFGQVSQSDLLPSELPVDLEVGIHLWKVYEINTVDETFSVDGYLLCSWKDERMSFDSAQHNVGEITYFNDRIDDLRDTTLWFPELEIINALGGRNVVNQSLRIKSDGKINYVERFHATLKHELTFHQFPFDVQELKIIIEPFSRNTKEVRIESVKFGQASGTDAIETCGWEILNSDYELTYSQDVNEYQSSDSVATNRSAPESKEVTRYSRAVCSLTVKRLSGYYVWQLMFPLVIIMIGSISIFWIEDYPTQIGVGFTLLLTIVAFNFFAESLLPKLPYNTYAEVLIILGYLFMLLCIFLCVYINALSQRNPEGVEKWFRYSKLYYPIILISTIVISTLVYFG